jgi:hypothetical protein
MVAECGGSAVVDGPTPVGSGFTAFVVVTDAMREKRNLLKADEPLIRVPKKREEEAEEGRNKKMEIGKERRRGGMQRRGGRGE